MGSSCRIGIDIGGTFTDVILVDETSGAYHRVKVPSVPSDPAIGAAQGVAKVLAQSGHKPDDVVYFCHGTTVATNAILEGNVSPTALITTKGFRDVLEIGRQKRPDPYSFHAEKAKILVPRNWRYEVNERLDVRGAVVAPLDEASVRAVVRQIKAEPVRTVAVCLLHSFMNSAHEQRVRIIFQEELPDIPVYLSVEVLPEYREFERTSTVVLSAAVAPVVGRYVQSLEDRLHATGLNCELHLMKSTGGLMPFHTVETRAVETVLSGPAAGTLAVAYWGAAAGYGKLIGVDIGGTSTDVSLVVDGKPSITTEGAVGEYPVKVPMIDIRTIGAGGGSIGWIDIAGGLHAGPQSNGADPGPACYGRQNTKPSVTDAHLVLGRLNPHNFAGGSIQPDLEGARHAIGLLAEKLGTDIYNAALGMVHVTESNMARAIREIAVSKGQDVREFVLLAFGGGGALHACNLAAELDVDTILVPEDAGLLSAHGLLIADIKNEQSLTRLSKAAETKDDDLEVHFREIEANAREQLMRENLDPAKAKIRRSIDMRYVGQAYEINVPLENGTENTIVAAIERFHAKHAQLYWWSDKHRGVQIVTLRIEAAIEVPKLPVVRSKKSGTETAGALKGRRHVCFLNADPISTPIYDRDKLQPGHVIAGPAIVESFDTTLVVNPGFQAEMNDLRQLVVERAAKAARAADAVDRSVVAVEVLQNRLISIAYETGAVLRRTGHSPNIRDRADFSCVLADEDGNIIAQAEHMPGHLGMLAVAMTKICEYIPKQRWRNGDVLMFNNPYLGAAHLPDIRIVVPIFFQNKLVAFAANLAHHADVGGMVPGSMPANATELFQEGVQIPPVMLYKEGILQQDIMDFLLANVRTPEERQGDIQAQVAAAQLGARRVVEVVEKLGYEAFIRTKNAMMDQSERLMRAKIREMLPEGEYRAHMFVEDDGSGTGPARVEVALRVRGDSIDVDFTGSAAQRASSANCTWGMTLSAAYMVLKGTIGPNIPANSGCYRPISVIAPEGTVVNPHYPAAVASGNETQQRLSEVVIAAFAKINPRYVKSPSHGCMNNVVLGGVDQTRRPWTYYETIGGGDGARYNKDGMDGVHVLGTNSLNTPVEVVETSFPLRIEAYSLIDGTGGEGQFRGGLGIRRRIRALVPDTQLTVNSDWVNIKPDGLEGGKAGAFTRIIINEGQPNEEVMPSPRFVRTLKAGETITMASGGGCGYGDPAERDANSHALDLLEQKVTT
jgi:N-methylhydantoinase A/oxoprolinase/acetone carboxylase beta subunit/N-methylhydantoinase B/oxoprolinase/acetone carboxylase alpha subunit